MALRHPIRRMDNSSIGNLSAITTRQIKLLALSNLQRLSIRFDELGLVFGLLKGLLDSLDNSSPLLQTVLLQRYEFSGQHTTASSGVKSWIANQIECQAIRNGCCK
jgi:hypothetical protein